MQLTTATPLVKGAIGLAAWVVYSTAQKGILSKRQYSQMQTIAAMKSHNNNNMNQDISQLTQGWKRVDRVPDDFYHWCGAFQEIDGPVIRRNGDLCVCLDDLLEDNDDSSNDKDKDKNSTPPKKNNPQSLQQQVAVWGKEPLPLTSTPLLDFCKTHCNKPVVEEDLAARVMLQTQLQQAMDKRSAPSFSALVGNYSFCHRDYVSSEELNAMVCRRWGIQNLLIRFQNVSALELRPDHSVCLRDRARVFGIVPLQIDWKGNWQTVKPNDNGNRIQWNQVNVRFGWQRFGKTFAKLGEKILKKGRLWRLQIPSESASSNDLLVANVQDKGNILWANDKLQRQQPATKRSLWSRNRPSAVKAVLTTLLFANISV